MLREEVGQADTGSPMAGHYNAEGELHMGRGITEQLWRELCAVEYKIYVVGYGNDGDPRNDISPASYSQRAAELAARLSRQVAIPPRELRSRASDAAYAHGQDPGTDHDPDRFALPIWSEWGSHDVLR